MKPALVLHLFYEDLARDLVRRVERVADQFDIFATGPAEHVVGEELRRFAPNAEWIETDGAGFDIGPFLTVLPVLAERGYDVFCKLHTKRRGVLGQRWRELFLRTLIAEDAVANLAAAFDRHDDLVLAGPGDLYLAVEDNLHANGMAMRKLAPVCFPGLALPRSWGFFAGTMFWGRVAAFEPMLAIARSGVELERSGLRRDGQTAHAVERLFGLVPFLADGRVGLVDASTAKVAVGAPDRGRPVDSLVALAKAGHPAIESKVSKAEAAAIEAENPLLHYLRAPAAARHDPNPWFSEDWYQRYHRPDAPGLVEQARLGAEAPPPGPLFNAGRYLYRRPWLRRRRLNALAHFIAAGATDADSTESPAPEDDWRIADSPEDEPRDIRRMLLGHALGEAAELRIAINIAARTETVSEWGDVSFAEGMAASFERQGHEAEIRRRDAWEEGGNPDITIWLRGPEPAEPQPSSFNVLWVISHPDQVTIAEMEACDLVCVASESWAGLLASYLDVPVMALLQATDSERFRPARGELKPRPVLFVGNRRGEDRPVVRWALEGGVALEIFGHGWEGLVPEENLKGTRIDNRALPAKYQAAEAVLNDHWPAMKAFGIVSNRLVDVLAAGGVPVSDPHPALRTMLGGGVIEADGPDTIMTAIAKARMRPRAERLRLARSVSGSHNFDSRMVDMVDAVRHGPPAAASRSKGKAIIMVRGSGGPEGERLAFQRLLSPLHHDSCPLPISVQTGASDAAGRGDLVVVAMPAVTAAEADEAVKLARRSGARVVIDCAVPIPEEAGDDRSRMLSALRDADEVWVPTERFAEAVRRHARHVEIIPDAIDQRLWRDFHRPPAYRPGRVVRFGVMPGTPRADAERLAALLRDAAGGDVAALTILAFAGEGQRPAADVVMIPGVTTSYPRYVAWLRAHAEFDIAIVAAEHDDAAGLARARRAFLEASALGKPTLIVGSGGDEVAPEGLALTTVRDGLTDQLARIVCDPMPLAAIASAANRHLWRTNESAATAGQIDRRVRQLLLIDGNQPM